MISELTAALLDAKQTRGLSFADLCRLLGRDEVWVAALFYGQARASADEARTRADALGWEAGRTEPLTRFPDRADLLPTVPRDPLIDRLYEIVQVYGLPIKAIIHEKFGDGIMSAIDFTLNVEKVPDSAGDRVRLTLTGKFLPYKKW